MLRARRTIAPAPRPSGCRPTRQTHPAFLVNDLFSMLGIGAWKPLLTALLLPPVPLLLLVLVGARIIPGRRGPGWLILLLAVAGLWLGACTGAADLMTRHLLPVPSALGAAQIAQLRSDVKAVRRAPTIVVLGGGREPRAPEYGGANLSPMSAERLRYGLWLGRETGAGVAFSGGVGWSDDGGPAEAEVAERIAARDFGQPLRWIEDQSRDTRENALRTVAQLRRTGVQRVVVVTHGWHMPRARRLFEAAAGGQIEVIAAPMGLAPLSSGRVIDWIPSGEGLVRTRQVLRELLARAAGG